MDIKEISLVKYAGDFWVTLADYTKTRDIGGYSNEASVKSAIRTFIVRVNPDKYIAFRGEAQIKNIIQENRNNPLFREEDFRGLTRTALIPWDRVDVLEHRFNVSSEYKEYWEEFTHKAEEYIGEEGSNIELFSEDSGEGGGRLLKERSSMVLYLRSELKRMEKEMETLKTNKEKLLRAINSLETLEIPEQV